MLFRSYYQGLGAPAPEFEWRFHPERKWRMDIAWPGQKVAIEVDGGIWIAGGHNRGAQMKKDWEKRNAATAMGWKVFHCEPRDLCRDEFAKLVVCVVDKKGDEC